MTLFEFFLYAFTFIVTLNVWLFLGGLITFFLDDNHIYEHETHELLLMWFMFPIVIVLSLIEDNDAGQSNSEQS